LVPSLHFPEYFFSIFFVCFHFFLFGLVGIRVCVWNAVGTRTSVFCFCWILFFYYLVCSWHFS
jgi:hypothetical protein